MGGLVALAHRHDVHVVALTLEQSLCDHARTRKRKQKGDCIIQKQGKGKGTDRVRKKRCIQGESYQSQVRRNVKPTKGSMCPSPTTRY